MEVLFMNNYNMTKQTLTYNTPNSEQIMRKINQYEFKRQWKNNLKTIIETFIGE